MSARPERITIRRDAEREWRWHWQAGNNRITGASTQGYSKRAACIGNLQYLAGERVNWTYIFRGPAGEYRQGWLRGVFVEVIP